MDSAYRKVFNLLNISPRQSQQAIDSLMLFEQDCNLSFPRAVREWFSFVETPDIMQKMALIHAAVDIPQSYRLFGELNARYVRTAPSAKILPVLFENQGCWHMAVPLDGADDPPVYLGYQEADQFDWYLHAACFSDFIFAWVWDYVAYVKDYSVYASQHILPQDLQVIRETFEFGPTTYQGNGYFNADRIERYAQNTQRITVIINDTDIAVWFTAASAESLQTLLQGPWSQGNLLAQMGDVDLEQHKGRYHSD